MQHAFAAWMDEENPHTPFEFYADDIVVHCKTLREAETLRQAIAERLKLCKLELHPEKTKIVYCKDDNRRGSQEHEQFDFLGFRFRPRTALNKRTGQRFLCFLPAISPKASKAIREMVRSWTLSRYSDRSLEKIALDINAKVRGWKNYYGRFYPSALVPTWWSIESHLISWVRQKYKKLRAFTKARMWLKAIASRQPELMAHWPKTQPRRVLGAV